MLVKRRGLCLVVAWAFAEASTFLAVQSAAHAEEEKSLGASAWDAAVSATAIYARRARKLLDDIDASRVGTRAEIGWQFKRNYTRIRLEANAGLTDYTADSRGARFVGGARVGLRQTIAPGITAETQVAHAQNIVALESFRSDQTSVRAVLAMDRGKQRLEAFGGRRWREYEDAAGGKGDGWTFGGRYRYRFARDHWLALSAERDWIDSANPRRDYERTSFAADYSVPLSSDLRFVAAIDRRAWTYGGLTVGNMPGAPHRKDRLIRPEIGLAFGKSAGFYGRATAGYDFRKSNDPRYSGDGPRAGITLGYRF